MSGDRASRKPGSVRVTVADEGRRPKPAWVRIVILALTVVLVSAAVLWAARSLLGPGTPPTTLDPRSVTVSPQAGQPLGVPGATRLALLGPIPLLDMRNTAALGAGAAVDVALPVLPPGSSAVLLEVSVLAATGPGVVTVTSKAGEVTVLRPTRAGAQLTTTAVVAVTGDATIRVRTEGGGQLLVNLVGAFEPTQTATAGRIVAVPATQVLRLLPKNSGKDATIDLATVPAIRDAGTISAVLLQIAADVGLNGGFVAAGATANTLRQTFFWSATSGTDRTRAGFLVVPVTDGSVRVHYEAGNELRVSVVGFLTDGTAPSSPDGLIVPVPAGEPAQAQITAGGEADLTVKGGSVPADRVAAALVGITATGGGTGAVTAFKPDTAAPADPTVIAAPAVARSALTLAGLLDGKVRVNSEAGALVSVAPQAVILGP